MPGAAILMPHADGRDQNPQIATMPYEDARRTTLIRGAENAERTRRIGEIAGRRIANHRIFGPPSIDAKETDELMHHPTSVPMPPCPAP